MNKNAMSKLEVMTLYVFGKVALVEVVNTKELLVSWHARFFARTKLV